MLQLSNGIFMYAHIEKHKGVPPKSALCPACVWWGEGLPFVVLCVGAVLLVPHHPPMNELVREGSGVLLEPHLTFSHEDPPVPVLGKYGHISASMSPQVGWVHAGSREMTDRTASQ